MMLHSSELMPGGSPYNRTPGAVDDLFRRLETTFTHLASRGVEGMTLTDFARFRAAARRGKSAGGRRTIHRPRVAVRGGSPASHRGRLGAPLASGE